MRVLLDVKIPSGVALLGPRRLDDPWQARAGAGFDAQHFLIDREQECTTCPAGKTRYPRRALTIRP